MKKFLPVVWVAVVVLALFGARTFYVAQVEKNTQSKNGAAESLTYMIEGNPIALRNGVAVSNVIAGVGESRKAFQVRTRYIKTDAVGDLNGDGISDNAVILVQEDEGTRESYYVSVARGTSEGYRGTNAIYLGDHIEYHSTEIRGGEIVVHYRDRFPTEPKTAKPSMGVAKYFVLSGETLTQVQKSDSL